MRQAVQSEPHIIDGYLFRNFHIPPEGAGPIDELDDNQRLFLFYLAGSAPSTEDITRWMEYMNGVDAINKIDYCENENIGVLKMRAGLKGLTVEEFKELQNTKKRAQEIEKLKKDYGYSQDKKFTTAKDHIRELIQNLSEDDIAHKQLEQFFKRPEGLKKE